MNFVKKLIAILLVTLTVMSIAGCGKKISKTIIGTWYGENGTIVFKEDNTFISQWILNGEYEINENEITITSMVDSKKLIYDEDEEVLIYNDKPKFYKNKEDVPK
ncbi:MAG: hypothetical protein E7C47_09560 [Veillonella sp.]|uniref:hypothetical protein n=1 Tax=Veillonella sp. TaxID=1926307 RepID=UPI00290103BC|nr:hypothetical protein [Veillonella sp.]MDU2702373.1 hypothetical protein [Veillonella sp.]